jgi:autotransporter-associated beta strand protein
LNPSRRRFVLTPWLALIVGLAAPAAARGQSTYYWNSASAPGTLWGTTANWWAAPGGPANPAAPPGAGDLVQFNDPGVNGATTVQLDGPTSVLGLTFGNTGTTLLDSSSATSNPLTIGANGITINAGSGAVTLGNATNLMPVSLAASQTWANNSAGTFTVVNGVSATGAQTLTVGGTGNTTVSGAMTDGTGTLALTKADSGTLTLTGANTFTGATAVNGGTLVLGSGGTLANTTSITVTSGATLALSGAANNQFFANIPNATAAVNAGVLTVNGTLAVTTNFAHTLYPSTITLNNATIVAAANSTVYGALFVGNASRTITATGTNVISGTNVLGVGTGLTLTLSPTNAADSVLITGSVGTGTTGSLGGLTVAGAGTVVLNANSGLTGNTTIGSGTLELGPSYSGAGSAVLLNAGALQVDAAGKSLKSLAVADGTTLTLPAASAATTTLTGALTLTGTTNFTVKPVFAAAPGVGTYDLVTAASVAGTVGTIATDFTTYGATRVQGTTAVNGNKLQLTVTTPAANLVWNNATTDGTWGLGGSQNFNNGVSNDMFLSFDAVTFDDTTTTGGTVTLSGNLAPAGVTVNTAGTYTFNGPGSVVGIGGLTKSGSGTLVLNGTNMYAGGTNLTGGVLQVNNGGALGTIGTISFGGGTLQYTANNTIDYSPRFGTAAGQQYKVDTNGQTVTWAAALTSSGGTLTKLGAGTLILTGTNTYAGGTTVSAGTLQLGNGTTNSAPVGGYSIAGGALLRLRYNAGGVTGAPTFGTVTGAGTLALATGKSFDTGWGVPALPAGFTGTLQIEGGRIVPTSTGNFGGATGITVVGGGQLALYNFGNNTLPINLTIAGAGYGETNYESAVRMAQAGQSTVLSGAIMLSGSATLAATGTGTISNVISGAAGSTLTFGTAAQNGTVVLSGTNTYAGPTAVAFGTLRVAKEATLYNTPANWTPTNIVVNSGATLALNVGGPGEFTPADVASVAGLGTATGGFKNGAAIGLDTTNAPGGAFTYPSAIANPNGGANALGLTKLGTGTLTLTASHTYTGPTTVSAGTLALGAAGGVGTGLATSGVTVASGGTLGVQPGLSGATGGATNSVAGTLTLNAGSTLTMADGITGTFNVGGAATLAPASGTAPVLRFELGAANETADKLAITGAATVGAATATLFLTPLAAPNSPSNTYTLITAAGGLDANFTLDGAQNYNIGGTVYTAVLSGSTATSQVVSFAPGAATPGTAYWTGTTSGSWSAQNPDFTTNFTGDAAGQFNTLALPGATTTVVVSANAANNLAAMTLDGAVAVKGITFTGTGTGNTAGATIAAGAGGTLTINGGGITVLAGSGANTITAPVTLGAAQSWTNNSTGLLTVQGDVTNSAFLLTVAGTGNTTIGGGIGGTGGLTMSGSGVLTLSGTNTYTGTTTVTAGTLKAGSPAALNSANAVTLSGTATLDLNGNSVAIGALTSAATNTITDASAATTASTATTPGTPTGTGVYVDALFITGPASAVTAKVTDGPTRRTQVIVTNTGVGTYTPFANSANTFSGGVVLANGSGTGTVLGTRLAITSSTNFFGTGPIIIGQAATDKAGIWFTTTTGVTLARPVVFNTSLGTDRFGVRVDVANTTLSGAVTANADAVFSSNQTAGALALTNQVTGAGGLVLDLSQTSVANTVLTVTLNNATANPNNYLGDTVVGRANASTASAYAATLKLGRADQIPNGAGFGNLVLNNNTATRTGTLNLNGFNETVNGLGGNGTLDGGTGAPVFTVGDNNATSTFTGVIKNTAGSLMLTKIGGGTLSLSGANTYAGGTVINGGALSADATTGSATGTGAVTVNANGTLRGAGTVTGAVTVNAGGTLSAGGATSPGTLTATGGVTLSPGATFLVKLGGTGAGQSDLLNLGAAGTVNLGGAALTGALVNGYVPANTDSITIVSGTGATAVTGTFLQSTSVFVDTANGINYFADVTYNASTVVLSNFTATPVPEPGCVLAVGLAAAGLAGRIRRRRAGRSPSSGA